MTYNIHHGCGGDGVSDPARVAAVIAAAAPDLVALQEAAATGPTARAVAEATGLILYPGGDSGLAYLSRLPLRGLTPFALGQGGSCLAADLDCDGRRLQLYNVQLQQQGRAEQIAALLGDELLGHPRRALPVLLLGDFGDGVRGTGRLALNLALRRVGRPLGRATYPARFPLFARSRAYLRGDVRVCSCLILTASPARSASPHLPLQLELELTDRRRFLPTAAELAPRRMGTAAG